MINWREIFGLDRRKAADNIKVAYDYLTVPENIKDLDEGQRKLAEILDALSHRIDKMEMKIDSAVNEVLLSIDGKLEEKISGASIINGERIASIVERVVRLETFVEVAARNRNSERGGDNIIEDQT